MRFSLVHDGGLAHQENTLKFGARHAIEIAKN
jgi:hypothetical protein